MAERIHDVFGLQLSWHSLYCRVQTLHSVIIDVHHVPSDSADAAAAGRQLMLMSDQRHVIWRRVSQRQEAVSVALGLWHKYRTQLAELHSHLTQIDEVVCSDSQHDVASLPVQHVRMIRLEVRQAVLYHYWDNTTVSQRCDWSDNWSGGYVVGRVYVCIFLSVCLSLCLSVRNRMPSALWHC